MHRARLYLAVATVVVLMAAAGCGGAGSNSSGDAAPTRVILVVEENHSFDEIVGGNDSPNFARMVGAGVLLTSYFAITHPSLPNYIALLSGDTQGITADCQDCFRHVRSLPEQLEAAGVSWRAYMQGLPAPCSPAPSAAAYVRRHNPFMYFDHVRTTTSMCRNIVPLERFFSDLASGNLPQFVWITPDLDHDMHGGAEVAPFSAADHGLVRAADDWLGLLYAKLRGSSAWRHDTRLVVTFDEGLRKEHGQRESCCGGLATGGHVATVVVGPKVPHGVDPTNYTHYSLLRSIETLYGLPYLGHASRPTKDIPVISVR